MNPTDGNTNGSSDDASDGSGGGGILGWGGKENSILPLHWGLDPCLWLSACGLNRSW